ncbi:siderophore-interacting protein [Corynebacterium sp. 3HC-13]|uniref:siderophore-interacting protein n=1 Tax=Corynebacterium poyangense TaxID=2684405 RepID=UPI001CCC2901|nr:siderophore-interacting protein [Corynebacterium poyangense]MBZ8176739.1 siderophore-interacting protein [Corynebacterium poyangense]
MTCYPPEAFATRDIHIQPTRRGASIFSAKVLKKTWVNQNLLRIRLQSTDLHDLILTGPDEFFGLFMPRPGRRYIPLPPFEGGNIRKHTEFLPLDERPDLRWYTIRHFDQAQGTVDVDIATHGLSRNHADNAGPGLRWALSVSPGDSVGFYPTHGLWVNCWTNQLLIGDASSAPSIASIIEFQHLFHPSALDHTHVLIACESEQDIEPGLLDFWEGHLSSAAVVYAPLTSQAALIKQTLKSNRLSPKPQRLIHP